MNELQQIADRMLGVKILVIGDAMEDVYHFGRVTRLSQEAPVPVFVEERCERRPGGAANVSEQLQTLGLDVTNSFAPPRHRCIKHRWLHGTHQLFRQDEDHTGEADAKAILKTLGALGCDMKAVVLSDYGKGWLNPAMCLEVIEHANELGLPIVVDPKGKDWSKYKGATVLCPNTEEFFAVSDPFPTPEARIVWKMGEQGLSVHKFTPVARSACTLTLPAQVRHVYDVTGAGDTVTALIAAGLAVGAMLEEAAMIANIAAGWVVGEVGTASIDHQTLIDLLGGT